MPPGDGESVVWSMANDCLPRDLHKLTPWESPASWVEKSDCPHRERTPFFLLGQCHLKCHLNSHTGVIKTQNARLWLDNLKFICSTDSICLHDQGVTLCSGRPPWHTKAQSEGCLVRIELEQEESHESSIQWKGLRRPDPSISPTSTAWLVGLTLHVCCLRCHLYSRAMLGWVLPMLVSSSPLLCFHHWPSLLRIGTLLFSS